MKTGYINPRPRFTLKQQVEILEAAGVPASRIYVEGERGETLDAACKAARDYLVHVADGMRGLGATPKAIREAMVMVEKRGAVIIDAARKQRSDKDRWSMYDWASGKVTAEKTGLNPGKSRQGGNARAAMHAADRLAEEKAKPIWKDKRFTTDKAACDYMNELHPPVKFGGWNPQLARRTFEASGRPRGNRAFKLKK